MKYNIKLCNGRKVGASMEFKINGINVGGLFSPQKVIKLCKELPDGELLTTTSLVNKLGIPAYLVNQRIDVFKNADITVVSGHRRFWGNPKTINAFRKEVL